MGDQRISRALFEKASGGDRSLDMTELQSLLMAKTLNRLRHLMIECNGRRHRHQERIHIFLNRINMGNIKRGSAIARFQKKLTGAFCRLTWQMLKRAARASAQKKIDNIALVEWSRSAVRQYMLDFMRERAEDAQRRSAELELEKDIVYQALHPHDTIQSYEITFMLRIFDRISIHSNAVTTNDIITSLVFLSEDLDRYMLFELLFDIFDTDHDKCLSFEDISKLFKCVYAKRPMFLEDARGVDDASFQKALSEQEGLHAFEIIQWTLLQRFRVDGGVVNKTELWDALQEHREILVQVLPCSVKMQWASERSPMERETDLVLEAEPSAPKPADKTELKKNRKATLFWTIAGGETILSADRPPSAFSGPSNFSEDAEDIGTAEFRSLAAQKFQQSLQKYCDMRNPERNAGIGMTRKPGAPCRRTVRAWSDSTLHRPRSEAKSRKSLAPLGGSQPQFVVPDLPERIHTQHFGKAAIHRYKVFEAVTLGPRPNNNGNDPSQSHNFTCQCCKHQHLIRAHSQTR